jgi:hypothetical protein
MLIFCNQQLLLERFNRNGSWGRRPSDFKKFSLFKQSPVCRPHHRPVRIESVLTLSKRR